jgi:hypothetical protein
MHINKNIAVSETGFVFHPLSGDSYSTNKCGQFILKRLQENASFDELCDHVCEHFSVDRVTAEKDLTDFIHLLKNHQMLMDDE